jgi:hypothetical protein
MPSDFRNSTGLSLAIRNNNPGNIRPGQNFDGEVGENGGFSVFSDMSYGIRAWLICYHSYLVKDGVTTITEYIDRYAPPSDNNPNNANYVAAICKGTGLSPNDAPPRDQATVTQFFIAQVNFESADEESDISADDIQAGFDLYNASHAAFFLPLSKTPLEAVTALSDFPFFS